MTGRDPSVAILPQDSHPSPDAQLRILKDLATGIDPSTRNGRSPSGTGQAGFASFVGCSLRILKKLAEIEDGKVKVEEGDYPRPGVFGKDVILWELRHGGLLRI